MNAIGSMASGLQSALLLARGRPEGVELIDAGHAAAVGSFWALPLCLPAVICIKLLDWVGTRIPSNAPVALGRYLLLFSIGWLLFVWLSEYVASMLGKKAEWPRFIAVWSYCGVVENTLIALGGLPGAFGVPAIVDQAFQLITVGWAFWLEWYGIRLSLRVGALTATTLLVVDLTIGSFMILISSLLG